jgi:hypothetical protein
VHGKIFSRANGSTYQPPFLIHTIMAAKKRKAVKKTAKKAVKKTAKKAVKKARKAAKKRA